MLSVSVFQCSCIQLLVKCLTVAWHLSSCVATNVCVLLQTYSQLAHPIQQARALGLLFQSKILDIDNIDVSDSHPPSHFLLYALCFANFLTLTFSLFSLFPRYDNSTHHLLFPRLLINKVSVESCSYSCSACSPHLICLYVAAGDGEDDGPGPGADHHLPGTGRHGDP